MHAVESNLVENRPPVKVTLRPYQLAAIEAIRAAIRAGKKRILLVVPTGGGKTLVGATMMIGALAKGKRSLFVMHRRELIDQSCRAFARLGVVDVGVIRASDPRRNERAGVQIASIQTLSRRAKPENISLVVIDEAHRSMAASYVKHVFEPYEGQIVIGLTATPTRQDGKPLGRVEGRPEGYDEMIVAAKYSELIEQGHIEEPLVFSTPVLPDLSKVKTSGGDYDQQQLEEAVNRSVLIGDIVDNWRKHASDRRTVVFCVSVQHSLAVMAAFVSAGVRCEHLDGETPEGERAAILARLEAGTTQVVTGIGVLVEGWDQPSCKAIVLACPTKSLVKFMQMGGRGLRPWVDATGLRVRPIILDHGCNTDRFGFVHEDREWSLTAKPKRSAGAPTKMCPECFAMIGAAFGVCPHCGHTFVVEQALREEPEDLSAVELALRTMTGEDAQLAFYRRLTHMARERGWKPGAIYHRFVEKFGKEPPREWGRALKKAARADAVWREGIERRKAAGVTL